jgi:hypothetical protein
LRQIGLWRFVENPTSHHDLLVSESPRDPPPRGS